MAAGGADEAVGPALGCEMPSAGGFIGKARLEGGAGHRAVVLPAVGHDGTLGEHYADGNGERAVKGATVYTDDHGGYHGMPFKHETVKHSVSEYVNGMAHTNGIESFWSLLKRGYHGTYHHMSEKHLGRYVWEFTWRHNCRDADTIDQMSGVIAGMVGKRLRYTDLAS